MNRFILCIGVAVIVLPAAAQAQFRVLPYQQQPAEDGMLITWFTDNNHPGELVITGGDLDSHVAYYSTPELKELLTYRQPELDDAVSNGYTILADENYKHSINVTGLSPNTTYSYTVTQGAATFSATLATAPTASHWQDIRAAILSDSETEPRGAVQTRDWTEGPQAPGSLGRPADWPVDGSNRQVYMLNQQDGYAQNLRIIDERQPDMVIMPGDLVQGGGYQFGWDEFFRHNAGEFDDVLTKRPILPALGNWENFAAVNGGYGISADFNAVGYSRSKYKAYFDMPENGTPEHQDNYYRTDYGPLCILTLDSSNGEPDVAPGDRGNAATPNTDTQINYTAAVYRANNTTAQFTDGTDLSDFNPGSVQYNWVVAQLEECRHDNKIIVAQWHNVAYSSGVHGIPNAGLPPEFAANASGQAGTPLRQYQPLFDEYGVAAVFSGHSEIAERSYVNEDADEIGVNYYDVGIGGDGMRGTRTDTDLAVQNPFSQWTAHLDVPELWEEVSNDSGQYTILTEGGKHYGHLEMNLSQCSGPPVMTLAMAYSFPNLDADLNLIGDTERRIYDDVQQIVFNATGEPVSQTEVSLLVGENRRSDFLIGTDGPDFIAGLSGLDILYGGAGIDTYIYNDMSERGDVLVDFEVGEDRIDLVSLLSRLGVSSDDPIADGYIKFRRSFSLFSFFSRRADTLVLVDADGAGPSRPRILMKVIGVRPARLKNSCNFIF
ncbi:MAG: fibronectin type III domain-containing protein [Pseudomonadota bacterium]